MKTKSIIFMLLLSSCGSEVTLQISPDVGEPDMSQDIGLDVVLDATDPRDDAETDQPIDVEVDQPVDAVGEVDMPTPEEPFSTLPKCKISVMEAFTTARMDPPSAASNDYAVPSQDSVDKFGDAIRLTLDGKFQAGLTSAQDVGYSICRGAGEYADTVLFEPKDRGTGYPALAVRTRKADASRLMFQAPHILHDRNTMTQAAHFFEELDARALLASGTHRCASNKSGCSGSSSVCNRADGGYAESDMAHSVKSFYQAAHEAVSESYTQDLVISVHGMSRAGVSISNGTRRDVDSDSPVARVVKALRSDGIEEVTACNDGTAAPKVNYLCGTTNTQGRHLNGSTNSCTKSATTASDRFLHLEQERSLRDNPPRLVNALKDALRPEMGL